jgi:epoxyqueuosine reductase
MQSLEDQVKAAAIAAGFDTVGVARLDDLGEEPGRRLDRFLDEGRHGDMAWMETHAARRRHPRALWPEARSAVVCGQSYAPAADPMRILAEPGRGAVSVYAQGRDYHDIVKSRLRRVAGVLQHATEGADVKVFVDTAPLMEKPLAGLAGLGWQGRHTNLVARDHGSWLFLGVVLTTAELVPDRAHEDRCGSCRRCLDVCPTDAFPAPYQLDPRRCIAYLTIEHKAPIPRALRAPMGNRVFGCDDCLAVCPWNKFAAHTREIRLRGGPETDSPPLAELLVLDDATFRQRFAGTPVKRTGRDRFVRNVAIAAGNSGERQLAGLLEPLLDDESPLVRGAAVWALARLVGADALGDLRQRRGTPDPDPQVEAEWQAELRP